MHMELVEQGWRLLMFHRIHELFKIIGALGFPTILAYFIWVYLLAPTIWVERFFSFFIIGLLWVCFASILVIILNE